MFKRIRNSREKVLSGLRFSVTVLTFILLYGSHGAAETAIRDGGIVVSESFYKFADKDLIKISFTEGSAELTNESLTALANFEKVTKSESKIDRYIVAAWADQNYPLKGKLSKKEMKLAELRSLHVKEALAAAGAGKVHTFEMTKRPNWIQRAFSTETAEIKNNGSNMTGNEEVLKEIGKRLSDKGGPMSVVVVAKFKNEVSTK